MFPIWVVIVLSFLLNGCAVTWEVTRTPSPIVVIYQNPPPQSFSERVFNALDDATRRPYIERYEVSGIYYYRVWERYEVYSGGTGSIRGRDPQTLQPYVIDYGAGNRRRR